jgi:two-component system, chemotaxis family, chemotaxis protein CheY
MRNNLNFKDLNILLADSNPYFCKMIQTILRGFGANRFTEVGTCALALQVMQNSKVDIMICDIKLPPLGGIEFARKIRMTPDMPGRTLPILLLSSHTSPRVVTDARNAGTNMVLTKPFSPATLYERLAWIAFHPRQFIDCPTYFGPDRRFKIEGYSDGPGRRAGDKPVDLSDETGPNLCQSDIDSLFTATRSGQF